MSSITDKVIAYRLPQDGAEGEAYGVCLRRQENTLRVIVLQEGESNEEALKLGLQRLSDEDAVVNSLEDRYQCLQSQLSEEHSATKPKSCLSQETLLRWAIHHLERTKESEWTLLSQPRRPSVVVSAVGCTVASIVADNKLVSSTWSDAQKLLCSGEELVRQLRQASEKRMDRSLYDFIERTYLSNSTLFYSSVSQESPLLGLLHKWITAFMDYQHARYMRNSEVELQRQITDCQRSLRLARERRCLLANQADLIKRGNCYRRTKTVRSVPVEHVLYLVIAEKVTTRQFLFKERVPREFLEEVLAKPFARPYNYRHDFKGMHSRPSPFSASGVDHANRILASALTSPAPKAESAQAGACVNGLDMQHPRTSIDEGDNVDGLETCHSVALSSTDDLGELDVNTHIVRATKVTPGWGSCASSSDGKAVVGRTIIATSTATNAVAVSSTIRAEKQTGADLPSPAPSALSVSDNPQHVLAEVKNHFESVQETLLDCFEEYEQLEKKYSKTVEHSRQLLETLEARDDEVGRLRESLSHATRGQGLAGRLIASLKQNQHRPSKSYSCNGYQNCADEAPLHLETSSTLHADNFAKHVEYLLEDTLDFVRGAAAAPSM
ncbi:hypothetical protein JKF63_01826 [Porcisia hertigi]|uniref:Uncharacterized protein n=1 Tax=Porcisia hertigi TaxID=2761500 RepID=A0A836IGH7_9TRYP|nr:hypothetical protein JKF63_01826 [Porcisia hertigi]